MPRVRFSIQRMMIAIAVVGLILGAERMLYDLADATTAAEIPRRQARVREGWLLFNMPFAGCIIGECIRRHMAKGRARRNGSR